MLNQRNAVPGKSDTVTYIEWADPESGTDYLIPVEPVYVVTPRGNRR